jgi:hypothetical protein
MDDDAENILEDQLQQVGNHPLNGVAGYPYGFNSNHSTEDFDEAAFNHSFLRQHHVYDDSDFDDSDERPWYNNQRFLSYVNIAIVLFLVISCARFHKDGVQNWWRRRVAAARYKRMKKDDSSPDAEQELDSAPYVSGSEDEPTFFETLRATISADAQVPCTVDLGDGAGVHTIDASVAKLEKLSELPFCVQDACKVSGVPQLSALSLVDLWLKQRAVIYLLPAGGGAPVEAGKGVTPKDVRRAKGFRVTILPQSTR